MGPLSGAKEYKVKCTKVLSVQKRNLSVLTGDEWKLGHRTEKINGGNQERNGKRESQANWQNSGHHGGFGGARWRRDGQGQQHKQTRDQQRRRSGEGQNAVPAEVLCVPLRL